MTSARPGIALKRLRARSKWTLADVSKRTGIPASTLSRIENDQISPTYDLLVRLSRGLAIDLTQLLSAAEAPPPTGADQSGRRSVSRIGDGDVVQMPLHTLRYLNTDLLNKQMAPILCEYRARSLEEFGDFMRHAGEEFLLILEGEVELRTECYAPLVLKAGESIYFDSRMGHAYIARGEGPCRALSICTVPRVDEPRVGDAAVPAGDAPLSGGGAEPARSKRAKASHRRSRRSA